MMRYKVLLFFLLVLWVAQTAKSQDVALKTNTLMWATTTPNLGLEVALSPRYTLELSGILQSLDIQGRQEDAFLVGTT